MGPDHLDDRRIGGGDLVSCRPRAIGSVRASNYSRDRVLDSSESGSAPAEFVLVSALMVALFLGFLQVVFVGYVRHAITAAALEGARLGGQIDSSLADATHRTRLLLGPSASATSEHSVWAEYSGELGVPTVTVRVSAPYPALGVWTTGGFLEVTAHAPREYVR